MKLIERRFSVRSCYGILLGGVCTIFLVFVLIARLESVIYSGDYFGTYAWPCFSFIIPLALGTNLIQLGILSLFMSEKSKSVRLCRKYLALETSAMGIVFVFLPALIYFQFNTVGLVIIGLIISFDSV